MFSRFIRVIARDRVSSLFKAESFPLYGLTHFVYPVICCWTLGPFPHFACCEHSCTNICSSPPGRSRQLSAIPFLLGECPSAHPRVHGACACVGTCVVCARLHGGVFCAGPCVLCVHELTRVRRARHTSAAAPSLRPPEPALQLPRSSAPAPVLSGPGWRERRTRLLASGEGGGSTVSPGVLPETTLVHNLGCRGGNACDHYFHPVTRVRPVFPAGAHHSALVGPSRGLTSPPRPPGVRKGGVSPDGWMGRAPPRHGQQRAAQANPGASAGPQHL